MLSGSFRPLLVVVAALVVTPFTVAGPFTSSGISYTDPRFVGWATGVSNLTRGPQNASVPGSPPASFGTAANALGVANGSTLVSLGDGGSITLTFARPIANGAGADFAVFENGFTFGGRIYAELGHVEVSSNGVDFFRFPSTSLTQTNTQLGGFDLIDPTDVNNLAGQFPAGFGTGFDLAEMVGVSPLLDIGSVTHVRIVDVVGSISPLFGTRDASGRLINDPFATPFASGGFDLDGVGVINQVVPEPGSILLMAGVVAVVPLYRRLARRRAEGGA